MPRDDAYLRELGGVAPHVAQAVAAIPGHVRRALTGEAVRALTANCEACLAPAARHRAARRVAGTGDPR